GVVDVVGDDRAAAGDLVTDELRGDELRDACAEGFARVLAQQVRLTDRVDALVLADRDELHLRRDDAAARVMHLGHVGTGQRAARQWTIAETDRVQPCVVFALASELRRQAGQRLGVATLLDPAGAQRRQPAGQVDPRVGIGVGAGGVVDRERGVLLAAEDGRRARQFDLAHRYAQVGARAGDEDLVRARDRAHDVGRQLLGLLLQRGGNGIHGVRPVAAWTKRRRTATAGPGPAKLPTAAGVDGIADLARIRFEGSVSTGLVCPVPPLQRAFDHAFRRTASCGR